MLQILLIFLALWRTTIASAAMFPQSADPFLAFWEDKGARTGFDELDDSRFVPATPDLLNAGFTASAIWLRLQLDNPTDSELQRFLELELASISLFDVYVPGRKEPVLSGGRKRGWNPDVHHRHPVVNLSSAPHSRGIWYIRLESNYSLCIIAWLHNAESLAVKEAREDLTFGAYAALLSFALMISLSMFHSTRHRSFFHFSLVLLCYHIGLQANVFGWTWIHLWPQATFWADRANVLFLELGCLTGILFFHRTVEQQPTQPMLRALFRLSLLKCLAVMLLCLGPLTSGLTAFSVQGAGILMLVHYAAALYLWHRGNRLAGYHSMGWLIVMLVSTLFILQASGRLAVEQVWFRSALRFEFQLLACALQAGFLAIAAGRQFQKTQKDRELDHAARLRLEQNLDDAHVVQDAFIPGNLQKRQFEIVTAHHPSARIGGDWLGYHHEPGHERLLLAICDVTGHGLPAALLSGAIHGAFHGLARTEELQALEAPDLLDTLMQKMNTVVGMTAASTSLLATMLILSIDLKTGRIDYCNAGHTALVVVRADQPVYLLRGGSPLGLSEKPAFGAGRFQGQAGDTIFLHTDGLIDNLRSLRRMQLHHLCRVLSSKEPLEVLQKKIEARTGPAVTTMEDDSSYIICRLTAA